MTKAQFIERFKDASDNAEIYFLAHPGDQQFFEEVATGDLSYKCHKEDSQGNKIEDGSIILFPW